MVSTKKNPQQKYKAKMKGFKAYNYTETSNHKGRQQAREKDMKQLQKKEKEKNKKQKTTNKLVVVSPYLSIITFYVNKLNYLIKHHRVTKGIKNKTHYMQPRRDLPQLERHRLKGKGWKKLF